MTDEGAVAGVELILFYAKMRHRSVCKRRSVPKGELYFCLADLVPPDRVGVEMQGEAIRHVQAVPEAPLSGKQMRYSTKNCNICAKIKSFGEKHLDKLSEVVILKPPQEC